MGMILSVSLNPPQTWPLPQFFLRGTHQVYPPKLQKIQTKNNQKWFRSQGTLSLPDNANAASSSWTFRSVCARVCVSKCQDDRWSRCVYCLVYSSLLSAHLSSSSSEWTRRRRSLYELVVVSVANTSSTFVIWSFCNHNLFSFYFHKYQ